MNQDYFLSKLILLPWKSSNDKTLNTAVLTISTFQQKKKEKWIFEGTYL
jgi:hypothetical protein